MKGEVKTELGAAPGFRVWHGEPYSTMQAHRHDEVEINYAVGGSLTYLIAGSAARVEPGRLSMFWAGMPHSVLRRTGVERFYWVYVPLVWVLGLGLPESFLQRLMSGELVADSEPNEASDRAMLDRWSEELPDADDARRRLIVREVEARVIRLALAQPHRADDAPLPSADGSAGKVADMARFVAERHAGSLSVGEVAEHVGLHPNYAMTLFRKHYGMTLSAYLTRIRVCQAQNLLITTDLHASRIAFDVGFGSVSRFYEAFKGISGCTPRQYRLESGAQGYGPKSPFNPCSPAG